MPSQPHHEPREAHAVVPHRECLLTFPGDKRIDDNECAIKMKSDKPERHADLRGGNRASESMTCSEFFKCGLKTMLVGNIVGLSNAGYRFGYAPKTRITEQENVESGHHTPPSAKRESWSIAHRSTEGAMFEPVSTSNTVCPSISWRFCQAAASAAAADGSTIMWHSSMSVRMPANSSSSLTTLTSSTRAQTARKANSAGTRHTSPSAIVAVGSSTA